MLYQFSGEGDRPTYFEMLASEQLPGSLKAAVLYVLGVMAQRAPRLHSLLDYGEEAMAGLMLLLEWHNLRTHDGSFGESLFGLRRERHSPQAQGAAPATSTGSLGQRQRAEPMPGTGAAAAAAAAGKQLRRRDRLASLVFLVGVPYLKAKLHAAYMRRRQQALTAALWTEDTQGSSQEHRAQPGSWLWGLHRQASSTQQQWRQSPSHPHTRLSLRELLSRVGFALYPWAHAQYEGLLFAYQLLYMLDATPYYLPSLRMLSLRVRRCSPEELQQAQNQIESRRETEFSRIKGPDWFREAAGGFLRHAYSALDYAQTGIIAAVFLFKMLEWWYQSGEQKLLAPAVFPPPPPPPQPKPAPGGLPLPGDKRLCPLCLKPRTNPTLCAVSGYAFCYPCVFAYVDQYKRCPITHFTTDVSQLRRLFLNA